MGGFSPRRREDGIVKFLLGALLICLSFFHLNESAHAASYNNCQITGYQAHTNVAPDYIHRFGVFRKIKVTDWEGCFIKATLLSHKYTHENNKYGVHRFYTSSGPVSFMGTLKRVRIFKWIFRHQDGSYSSGIISKYTDHNVIEPALGFHAYDASGFLLNIDSSEIEKN